MEESGIDIPTDVENFVVELEENAKTGILVAYGDALNGVDSQVTVFGCAIYSELIFTYDSVLQMATSLYNKVRLLDVRTYPC